jgi:hypothetical protein
VPLAAPLDARRALLAGLIDHAPTFPPAELPLAEALRAHDAAVHSEPGWIVNRFVVRASQLADLPRDWMHPLSIVVDSDVLTYDARIEAVELAHDDAVAHEPVTWPSHGGALPDPPEAYLEHPVGKRFDEWVARLAGSGRRAKIRCGGAAVPSIDDLAAALRACRSHEIPLKATAGLHHAVRTDDQHGFLNLLAAAAFGDEEAALAETGPAAFSVDEEAFRWRDRTATPDEIAAMRRDLFVSFGSCSFDEPVDELRALGFL